MIKLQNNTLSRTPLPAFLLGLQSESLLDLSWTDPALGVSDCAWLPEIDISESLSTHQKYEGETLTLSPDRKTVQVVRAIVPWSASEIEAERKASIPQSVTMRQARLALLGAGLLPAVNAAIAAMPEPDKTAAQITWEFAATVDRGFGMVPQLAAALGMTEVQIDDLFIAAAQL